MLQSFKMDRIWVIISYMLVYKLRYVPFRILLICTNPSPVSAAAAGDYFGAERGLPLHQPAAGAAKPTLQQHSLCLRYDFMHYVIPLCVELG